MCGIVGLLSARAAIEEALLRSMADRIAHRGPDDEGYYVNENVGLASKRLSIIDIEGGHQPLSNEDGSVRVVYNGEIYNYLELRRDLAKRGHVFRTLSDTETIVHLYEEYGTDCLEKLNGMFAFALWDDAKRILFVARDRLGIKPLYYVSGDGFFAVASEIKALLAHPKIAASPDYAAINEYMTFQFCLEDRTLFEGIRRLMPGHYVVAREAPGGALDEQVVQYWDLDYTIDENTSEETFAEELATLLEDSVRLRLRSDVPVGAHLSGGLDSSSIVSLAAGLHRESKLRTFTGGFAADGYDETFFARRVAEAAGTEPFEIFPTAEDFVRDIADLIYYLDEPVAGPGSFPQFAVSRLASQRVKVVLGGQGGDEIFGGYVRYLVAYLEQCIKGAIHEHQGEGRFVVTFETIRPNLHQLRRYTPMLKRFWREGLFDSMEARYFSLIDRCPDPGGLYSQELLSRGDADRTYDSFLHLFCRSDTKSYFNRMTHFDTKTLLPALLHVEDRTSMAFSLESRVPLLDHRILELQARIPPTMRFAGGEAKHILKRAVRYLIPREILERKDKMGFPVPLAAWARGPIRPFLEDLLLTGSARRRGIYNADGVRDLIENEGEFDRRLWGVLCLELWFRTFIDG